MKKFIFPVVFALAAGLGLSGCGGGDDDGDLGQQQAELDCKQARIDQIEALQAIDPRSDAQQAELDAFYAQLEAEAEDPNLTCSGPVDTGEATDGSSN